jgi:hypothetical protein
VIFLRALSLSLSLPPHPSFFSLFFQAAAFVSAQIGCDTRRRSRFSLLLALFTDKLSNDVCRCFSMLHLLMPAAAADK